MNQFLIRSVILITSFFIFHIAGANSEIIVNASKKTIEAPIAEQYTWYFNGVELKTEHNQELKINATGVYTVMYETVLGVRFKSVFLLVAPDKIARIYLMGDSTVSDYRILPDYLENYPLSGWGEHLQLFLSRDSLYKVDQFILADSVVVYNRAIQGNSTKTYWKNGYFKFVKDQLQKDDYVFIQFGHNDEASCTEYPDRCVSLDSFKIYLNWFIDGIREKNAIPVFITPLVRSIWKDGVVTSDHGAYPDAMKEVGKNRNVPVIDLTQRSINFFNSKGQEYVNNNYFMIFPAGTYTNYHVTPQYPNGSPSNDNTHLREKGAYEMARLVFEGLQDLPPFQPEVTDIQIFPNPAVGSFTVRRPGATTANLSIINNKGAVVMKRTLKNTEEQIDITSLAGGLYVIILDDKKFKLIIL